ncbi:MAG: membrane protein insertase YidC [Rickettsiales bacterium]|nr:membrane protein insertase YidC [Rickettsiales bacterium]
MSDLKNTLTAIILTVAIIFGWQFFYDKPRSKSKQKQVTNTQTISKQQIPNNKVDEKFFTNRDEAIKKTKAGRVSINSSKLKGSISLRGARIDDLVLSKYKAALNKNSPATTLLSPSRYENAYFAEFGWLSDTEVEIPNSNTIWSVDKKTLKEGDSVNLTWKNSKGMAFNINIALDNDYMFTITQTVKNKGSNIITLRNYGLINRIVDKVEKSRVAYDGPIGVFNNVLKEVSYKDLESDKISIFNNNASGSWFGISDKYWLTAIIPQNLEGKNFNTKFQHVNHLGKNKFQVDYLSDTQILKPGNKLSKKVNFFAGAKVLSVLDAYERKYNISLFDRAIDFGWFYFITKPMFNALKYFYNLFGNFGISILVVTIIIKIFLFPLANKSYKSMNRMKVLQPQINSIKELYADDKMRQNQEILQLYKKEKVSPLSGCLPLLIQIPIFFSLYKVLFITIEMRHAPFYGWIKDLSAPDPTTIFNLFGLIPFAPPSFLMIGAWPIIMAVTMFFQQSFSPAPADPIQAKVMKFLPLFFLFMFASFPAGLVIYWAWSNMLSIAQQYSIKFLHEKNETN